MSNYRRYFYPGGTYFFTLVTEKRARILHLPKAREILNRAISHAKERFYFDIDAIVLLPDHLHMVLTLPKNDDQYSKRLGFIKKEFTKNWLQAGGQEQQISQSKQRHRHKGVWLRRFWEHTCQDLDDYSAHIDYIHYNPVRHGLVRCPHEWQWSSFHKFVKSGTYPENWGCPKNGAQEAPRDFTEIENQLGE